MRVIALMLVLGWFSFGVALGQIEGSSQEGVEGEQGSGAEEAEAEEPEVDVSARLYVSRCAGCHTIGRGALTGPDLTISIAWAEKDLYAGIERMQEKSGPMTEEEMTGLTRFLKDSKVHERIRNEEARISQQYAAKLAPPSIETGRQLFDGGRPFDHGGMACIACHVVRSHGGTLGPDLTDIFTRMGETGLRSACEQLQFKVMDAAYRDHPVTRQEAIHLTAYFASLEGNVEGNDEPPTGSVGIVLGVLGFLFAGVGSRYVLSRPRP